MEKQLVKPITGSFLQRKLRNPYASEAVIKLLNFRIEQEEYSSRLYHSMSMWLNDNGYEGAAKKWQEDADGEAQHAMWAKEYLLSLGVQPKIPALKEPPQKFSGLPEIIRESFKHEIDVTNQCNDLSNSALKTGDNLLYQLASKYMEEQIEEFDKLQNLMDKLEAFGEDKLAMRFLDNELKG